MYGRKKRDAGCKEERKGAGVSWMPVGEEVREMVTEIVIIVNTGGRVVKDTMKKAVEIVGEAFEDLEERPQVKIIFK